jgi:hypothetical protein
VSESQRNRRSWRRPRRHDLTARWINGFWEREEEGIWGQHFSPIHFAMLLSLLFSVLVLSLEDDPDLL